MSVLLPAPFSPARHMTSPARSSNVTPSSAWIGPYAFAAFAQRDDRGLRRGLGLALGDRGAHQPCAFAVGGLSSGLTSGDVHVRLVRDDRARVEVQRRQRLDRGHAGLDDALVAEEVRVLHDERVDRAVLQRRVLLRVGVEGDDRQALRGLVVLDRAGRAGAGGVVVGEDPDQVRVGGDDVVDLAGRGVDVVVVEPRRGDLDLRARRRRGRGGSRRRGPSASGCRRRRTRSSRRRSVLPCCLTSWHMRSPACSPALTLSVPMKPSAGRRHRGVGEDDLDPGRAGALDRAVERVGGVRREHDRVRAAGDRVLDELDLLVDVGLGRRAEQAHLQAVVAAGLARPGEHRLPERRVRRLDDHVDLLAGRRAAVAAAARGRRGRSRSGPRRRRRPRPSGRSRRRATTRTSASSSSWTCSLHSLVSVGVSELRKRFLNARTVPGGAIRVKKFALLTPENIDVLGSWIRPSCRPAMSETFPETSGRITARPGGVRRCARSPPSRA